MRKLFMWKLLAWTWTFVYGMESVLVLWRQCYRNRKTLKYTHTHTLNTQHSREIFQPRAESQKWTSCWFCQHFVMFFLKAKNHLKTYFVILGFLVERPVDFQAFNHNDLCTDVHLTNDKSVAINRWNMGFYFFTLSVIFFLP